MHLKSALNTMTSLKLKLTWGGFLLAHTGTLELHNDNNNNNNNNNNNYNNNNKIIIIIIIKLLLLSLLLLSLLWQILVTFVHVIITSTCGF